MGGVGWVWWVHLSGPDTDFDASRTGMQRALGSEVQELWKHLEAHRLERDRPYEPDWSSMMNAQWWAESW